MTNSALIGRSGDIEFRHFHFFCGLGGGARGFNRGSARVGNLRARFRCIGGIDNDPASIRDFERAAGVPGTVLDLFSREQYTAFHGCEPPVGWRPAGVDDIRRAAGGERPHIIFLSAPCKGFSGLLPEKSSASAKYQALNGLTVRGVMLMLEAWQDDPPELIIFENVPRIMTRGRHLLDQIVALLRAAGYAVAETTHDCGEVGGLGQSRKRFLLVARHEAKVPPFLYEPEKRRLRGVGEILERLPLPGDQRAGPMHRMPALQWKTWVRLAFVEAGSDWRSLNKLAVEDGVLRDFGIQPDANWHDGALGVLRWDQPSGVIKAKTDASTGRFAVADPRAASTREGTGFLGVNGWDEPTGLVTGNGRPGAGKFSVADPRAPAGTNPDFKGMRVVDWHNTAGAVTTQRSPGSSAQSVADPRVDGHEKSVQLGVRPWEKPAGVVTGKMFVGGGPNSVADPRITGKPRFNNVFRIVPWGGTSPAVAGPGGPAGGLAVADPRPAPRDDYKQTKYRVTGYDEAAGTVISASTTGNGAYAVADPRPGKSPEQLHGKFHVTPFGEPARAVIGGRENGAYVVADPRPVNDLRNGAHGVRAWGESSGTVAGESLPPNGAFSVADPRPVGLNENRDSYVTGGHYGVLPWRATAGAVPAYAKYDRGRWAVADPRDQDPAPLVDLPEPKDRLVAVIRALDGTWHRPFTTLELAALQSLFDPDEVFPTDEKVAGEIAQWERARFCLDGQSDSAWRERIGNAVPPDAAAAIAGVMGTTLLLAMTGETFMLSSQPIWVQPIAIALTVDQRGNDPEAL